MSTLIVYTFEGPGEYEQDWSTMDYKEAEEYASKYGYKIIANTYEWTDSELVKDCSNPEVHKQPPARLWKELKHTPDRDEDLEEDWTF